MSGRPDRSGPGSQPAEPLFLERRGYRRRRLRDAGRLLPLFGALLFLVPLLWPSGTGAVFDAPPPRTSNAILYIFAVWAALIVLTAILNLFLGGWERGADAGPEAADAPPPPRRTDPG